LLSLPLIFLGGYRPFTNKKHPQAGQFVSHCSQIEAQKSILVVRLPASLRGSCFCPLFLLDYRSLSRGISSHFWGRVSGPRCPGLHLLRSGSNIDAVHSLWRRFQVEPRFFSHRLYAVLIFVKPSVLSTKQGYLFHLTTPFLDSFRFRPPNLFCFILSLCLARVSSLCSTPLFPPRVFHF